jgi:tetratricopeptide (TPR) repeat protein
MKIFEDLEKEFLQIDTKDYPKLNSFYHQNVDYFQKLNFKQPEQTQKELWMLTDISDSFVNLSEYHIGSSLAKTTIRLFKEYSFRFNIDLKNDTFYKSLIYSSGIRQFNQKKYFRAIKYFMEFKKLNPDDFRIVDFYNICKYQIFHKVSKLFVFCGLIITISGFVIAFQSNKYDLIVDLSKYIGELLIMLWFIIFMFNKKPKLHKST